MAQASHHSATEMSNERATYVELKVSKDSRNQKRQPRGTRSSISVTEQEITYVEFSFQNTSPEHPSVCRDYCCKGFPSPLEKLITVILGIVSFALMVAVVLITTVAKPYTEPKEQIQPSLNTNPKDNNLSSAQPCGSCPKEWMSYSHRCYYISGEKKNWPDSLESCKSKNFSLLYIESEEEQEFLKSLSQFAWTSIFRESRDHLWVWKNDSTFKPKIREVTHVEQNCVVLSSSGLTADKCTDLHTYLCKHKLTN
ncbi:NKG2-C type II integral membrane protein-like [Arvicola amphibius]|uniref:NKG2-C type II integral membrane protein-like n=1 Tax=Arvicola amphibius TaxID=1047088 RepID=UPI0018E2E223|nr:NKG2-C type II integral membrane protein-like [Arvicola amphibius]XP_038176700.1 NKG2-C type II integral membrane protein-like [Arvicola amphibius]XP_038176701.1 NKG2-C type II integral membrane protein-like [Arvicola amphibius]XP_038176702.1 NKG2-C type II integral membrane protein-like [Arvicola amphibius]